MLIRAVLALALVTPLLAAPSPVWSADRYECKTNPEIVAPCYTIRGRMTPGNGTPGTRIWRVGTNRMLGVSHSEDPILPKALRDIVRSGRTIWGTYEVCPFTEERPGWMQAVCVETASDIFVEDYLSDTARNYSIPGTHRLSDEN